MIIALVAALALSGDAPSAQAAATSNAPAPAAAAPLREVVYKVTFTRRLEVSNETYGGSVLNDSSAGVQAGQAPPFAQANSDATDSGTVTVDVMQIAGDALGIRVKEQWTNATPSATYLGNVGADGSVNFTDGQMNECTRAILEYFGPSVMAGQPANSGVAWTRTSKGATADIDTTYSVGDIEGAIASIHEQSTVKSKSVSLIDTVVTIDVRYKPATLAPVSGRIVMHASRSGASSVTNVTTIGNFQRVSDTRDTGQ
ncbi:MAG TPA: hypothetical protein VII69_08425 [Candidatus Eremiobacteraceae bacterium]